MNISPAPIPNLFRSVDGRIITCRVIDVGDWDIYNTTETTVNIYPLLVEDILLVQPKVSHPNGQNYVYGPSYISIVPTVSKFYMHAYSNGIYQIVSIGVSDTFGDISWEGPPLPQLTLSLWFIK